MTLSYPFHSGAANRIRDFIVFFSIARTIVLQQSVLVIIWHSQVYFHRLYLRSLGI
jgi:hypothetical protein